MYLGHPGSRHRNLEHVARNKLLEARSNSERVGPKVGWFATPPSDDAAAQICARLSARLISLSLATPLRTAGNGNERDQKSPEERTSHTRAHGNLAKLETMSFFQDLWESIFTPGPTPSLLIATNVTFAALQAVLLALLIATYSIHFFILSGLCGGLWWAINWFARELQEAQRREEQDKAKRAAASGTRGAVPASSSDTETEVDTVAARVTAAAAVATAAATAAAASSVVEPVEKAGELKHRTAAVAEPLTPSAPSTKSGVSTEDEWEKVSENENEKDR